MRSGRWLRLFGTIDRCGLPIDLRPIDSRLAHFPTNWSQAWRQDEVFKCRKSQATGWCLTTPADEEHNSAFNFLNIPETSPASVEQRASDIGIDNVPADIEISHLVLITERTG